MSFWRWLNRLYAAVMGYFWLPCPRCGRMFGGHECGVDSVPSDRPGVRRVCCKFCCTGEGAWKIYIEG